MAEVLLTSEGIIRLNDRFLGPTLRKVVPKNARKLAEGFGFTVKVRGDDIYLVSGDYVAKISNRVEFYRVLTLSFADYFGGVWEYTEKDPRPVPDWVNDFASMLTIDGFGRSELDALV